MFPIVSATHIAIVDAESGRVCAPREIGEIWVSGDAVAAGYWNRSEESTRTFQNALDGHTTPFLRTGDLGFVDDGQLYVTGRLRHLIIIGGANHHAEDIEMEVAGSHPALERLGCAAFALDDGTTEGAAIVQEVPNETPRTTLREWRDAIAAAVTRHCTLPPRDVVFVSRRGIPRTSSGKLQRNECRRRYLAQDPPVIDGSDDAHLTGVAEPVAGTVSVEREVASICRSALGLSAIDPLRDGEAPIGRS